MIRIKHPELLRRVKAGRMNEDIDGFRSAFTDDISRGSIAKGLVILLEWMIEENIE